MEKMALYSCCRVWKVCFVIFILDTLFFIWQQKKSPNQKDQTSTLRDFPFIKYSYAVYGVYYV